MAIEVLLRRSIEGVGKVGEVVRVKNGYARNLLLPYQMAALVTPEATRNIEKDKAAEVVREALEAQQRAALSEKLAGIELRIECRAGEDGHLYGSVGPRQVIDTLRRHGLRFEERQVRFETVRELGEYEVPIQLSREHAVKVKLWVVLDPEDAKAHAEANERRAADEASMARYAAEHPPAPLPTPEGETAAAAPQTAESKAAAKAERAAAKAAAKASAGKDGAEKGGSEKGGSDKGASAKPAKKKK